MSALNDYPFAILTLIAAPAVFTNASSVLALGTGNRLARVVDRARFLTTEMRKSSATHDSHSNMLLKQLSRTEKRSRLLVEAMTFFYTGIGSFAAASLISLAGAALASSRFTLAYEIAIALGLVSGTIGFLCLVFGCTMLVRETRLAVFALREESRLAVEEFIQPEK